MTKTQFFILALIFAILLFLMPATQLWDWDEPLYARTGIEMFQSGNLLLPRFNDEVFAHKPPMGYWFMGLGVELLGQSEFAVRFFSAPALILAVWFTARTAERLFDERTAKATLIIFATSLMSLYLGAAAMLDAYLVAGISICVWALVRILDAPNWRDYLWFALGGAVALMVKGPVGPAILGLMALGCFAYLNPNQRPAWRSFWTLCGAGILAILVFLIWFIPANRASGGSLADEGIGIHIIGRALSPMEGHGGQGLLGFLAFVPFYLPVIFIGMVPWAAYIPNLFKRNRSRVDQRAFVILLAWFLPTLILFTFVATKLPHYIFPALAPMSILIARCIVMGDKASRLGRILTSLIYALLAAVVIFGASKASGDVSALRLGVGGFIMLALAILPWVWTRLNVAQIGVVVLIGMLGFYWTGLREVEKFFKLSVPIANAVKQHVGDDDLLLLGSYREPSIVFYAERPVDHPILDVARDEWVALISDRDMGFVIATSDDRAYLENQLPEIEFTQLAKAQAININANSADQVVFLLAWAKPSKAP